MLALESADSIRFLYLHFLSKVTEKSLNAFYYACSHAKADCSRFMAATVRPALEQIPENLKVQPVYLCVDDTMAAKSGTKFEHVSKLFGHAAHNGSSCLNGHCFVSLMLCIPVWKKRRISYLSLPLGYRMWKKKESKLEPAAAMARQAMPCLEGKENVIILCDSWYAKQDFICTINEYENLDIICNAGHDSVLYGLPPAPTGRRGRPAKHGKRLSITEDFTLSDEKTGEYFTGVRRVLANLFGERTVLAYVTATDRKEGSRRLFFSSIEPSQLHIFCAWYEDGLLRSTEWNQADYIPLFLYRFRWNIEVSYYEQKTFWSLCSYMARSQKGIEMLVNLVNISYCAMKLLPYQDTVFAKYKGYSVQEFRFALSEQIREQIFIASFVESLENGLKSNPVINVLKQRLFQHGQFNKKL